MTEKESPNESFFYHYICHSCKTISNEIKLCSGCRLVSYCSINHQKRDWKYHNEICRCVQSMMKEWNVTSIFGVESKTPEEWRHVRQSLICCIENKISRPLHIQEKQMFLFPNVCKFCFSANVSRKNKCDKCKVVYYCTEEHKNINMVIHNSSCSEVFNCYIFDKFMNCDAPSFYLPEKPFKTVANDEKTFFPNKMIDFLKLYYDCNNNNHILFSELFSGTLSILFAIYNCEILNFHNSRENAVLHIIGASNYEKCFIHTIDLFFHYMPYVKNLKISLIGPEAKECTNIKLCGSCEEEKTISVTTYKCLYQEFQLLEVFEKPDIVVAFNCGFCEYAHTSEDSWLTGLRNILSLKDTLFLFTSYTENEALEDYKRVNSLAKSDTNIFFNKIYLVNPFKSLRPQRDWENCDKDIFYLNSYLTSIELGI